MEDYEKAWLLFGGGFLLGGSGFERVRANHLQLESDGERCLDNLNKLDADPNDASDK